MSALEDRACHWVKCRKVFTPRTEKQKFCSPTCRTNHHNDKLMESVNIIKGLSTEELERVKNFVTQMRGGA